MKKYLAILLTLVAIVACKVTEPIVPPEVGPTPDPVVDTFILNARGAYKLGAESTLLVDTVLVDKYKAGDIIKSDNTVMYDYQKQYSDVLASYLNKGTSKYTIIGYDTTTATLVFYGPYDTEEDVNIAGDKATGDNPEPPAVDTSAPTVTPVDPFVITDISYNMPNARVFVVTHTGSPSVPAISERSGATVTPLYTYVKGLNTTQAIFKDIAGTKFVGIQTKEINGVMEIDLYATDGNPNNTWASAGTVRFTERHLYKNSGGGSTGGVPDNGLGYYADAKILLSAAAPITNSGQYKYPIAGWASDQLANAGNSIKNNHSSRIPTAVTLSDGTVVLTGDLRWSNDADAPHKTSSFVRISKDATATSWNDVKILNTFEDFDTDSFSGSAVNKRAAIGQITIGVGLVDNSIGVGQNDTLIALSMLNPPTVGLHGGSSASQTDVLPFTNFGGKDYLLLRESGQTEADLANYRTGGHKDKVNGPNNSTRPDDKSVFKYGVDVKGGPIVEFTTSGPKPVSPALYADEYWELYTDAKFTQKYMTNQIAVTDTFTYKWSDKKAHAHLFFYASPYAPSYVHSFIAYSKSDDKGRTWSKPKEISHQFKTDPRKYGILINSPAKGYLKRFGANKGRLLFSAYKFHGGVSSERPLVFWTDDKGENWESSDSFIDQSSDETGSESVIVEAPNGDLIIIARAAGTPTYAVSLDSGKTWSTLRTIPEPATKPGYWDGRAYNQLSAINISHYKAVNGRALIAISHAKGQAGKRRFGHVTFAALNLVGAKDSPTRTWELDFLFVDGEGVQRKYTESDEQHDYSGITELQNGNVSIFFEGSTWWGGYPQNAMDYVTIPLTGQ